MADEIEKEPLRLNPDEAYVLNQIFHLGMCVLFPDEPGSNVFETLPHADAYIRTKFNETTWYEFQDKINKFFLQYRKEGENVRHYGNAQPPTPPGGLN